jgi:hypothetical protein
MVVTISVVGVAGDDTGEIARCATPSENRWQRQVSDAPGARALGVGRHGRRRMHHTVGPPASMSTTAVISNPRR